MVYMRILSLVTLEEKNAQVSQIFGLSWWDTLSYLIRVVQNYARARQRIQCHSVHLTRDDVMVIDVCILCFAAQAAHSERNGSVPRLCSTALLKDLCLAWVCLVLSSSSSKKGAPKRPPSTRAHPSPQGYDCPELRGWQLFLADIWHHLPRLATPKPTR
jgi:hypothetical protein